MAEETTLEWFGATTFRLKAKGLTIFLDSWLERPSVLPHYLSIEDVDSVDYILISHAHFDHLPGADRLAIKTGATVVANGEAINCLREAGVPEAQLLPVAGGERIPLFTKEARDAAKNGTCTVAPGPPFAPPLPGTSQAVGSIHVWPSLHCLMPGKSHADIPDVMDTGVIYEGAASEYACSIDITRGMQYGLLRLEEIIPRSEMDAGTASFVEYIHDRQRNVMSHYDGGQLMFNILLGERTLLWSAHLGGYDGILKTIEPKPDVAILAIAGRANLNGRPFDGSAAQFATRFSQWVGEPEKIIWCLHDDSAIKPWYVNTDAAKEIVEQITRSRILYMDHAKPYQIFQ